MIQRCAPTLAVVLGWSLLSFSALPARAEDFSSPSFILRDPVITVEGGRATSSGFEYFSSTGQTVTGESTSGSFIYRSGFLYFSAPFPAPAPAPSPAPAGGGGGGVSPTVTGITFSGKAYPLSRVSLLKDGQLVITSVAGPDANFEMTLTGLTSGNYSFSVVGEDAEGRRSTLFTFPIFITGGALTRISGIFIAPTIAVDKSEVRRGENLAIFGSSVPQGEITIAISSEEEFFVKARSDESGVYLYNLDTSELILGQHFTKSKAALEEAASPFGRTVGFSVGLRTVLAQARQLVDQGDVNGDGRVNLVDFSIAAYWYRRPSPPAGIDLNGDGKITLVDFSIMAFHWTG